MSIDDLLLVKDLKADCDDVDDQMLEMNYLGLVAIPVIPERSGCDIMTWIESYPYLVEGSWEDLNKFKEEKRAAEKEEEG